MHGKIEPGKVEGPQGLMMVEFLCRHEVFQMFMGLSRFQICAEHPQGSDANPPVPG